MHEVDIGTYLKADAAQLFLKCLQPAQGCHWAREIFKKPKPTWDTVESTEQTRES